MARFNLTGHVVGKREKPYDMRADGGSQGVSYQVKVQAGDDGFDDATLVKVSADQYPAIRVGDEVSWPVDVVARNGRLDAKLPSELVIDAFAPLHQAV